MPDLLTTEQKQTVLELVRRYSAENPKRSMYSVRKQILQELGFCPAFDTLQRWKKLNFPDSVVYFGAQQTHGGKKAAKKRLPSEKQHDKKMEKPQPSKLENLLMEVVEEMKRKDISRLTLTAKGEVSIEQQRKFFI